MTKMIKRLSSLIRPKTGNSVLVFNLIAAVVALCVAVLILYPLAIMIGRTFFPGGVANLQGPLSVLAQPWVGQTMINTLVVVGASTGIAVAVGAGMAWLNNRTDANLGAIGFILPLIPLLIPSVALAIGWVLIAAPRVGFLNGALAALFGRDGPQLDIYSWAGLILVYSINGIPYVYLVVSAALQNVDPALEEASRTSGAGLWRTLRKVSLPAIRPAVIASALLVVISGLGLYSIPAIIATTANIDLLPTRIVQLLTRTYPPRGGEAQILGTVMLVVIVGLWMVQRWVSSRGRHVVMGGRVSGTGRLMLGKWRWPARLVMLTIMALASVIPLLALLVVALQPYWTPRVDFSNLTLVHFQTVLFEGRQTEAAFRNSLFLSGVGATIAMIIATLVAIYAHRSNSMTAKFADGSLKLPAAIPNLVIALGFLITFSGAPYYLSGTIVLLLMAFVVIYIPPGSIAANAAVTQVGKDLWEASSINGAGELRTVRKVVIPLAIPGLIAGWTMVFVHMMGDLSASALLAGIGNPVIGFTILEIWETGSFGQLAAFSTLMCVAITIIVLMTGLLIRVMRREM